MSDASPAPKNGLDAVLANIPWACERLGLPPEFAADLGDRIAEIDARFRRGEVCPNGNCREIPGNRQ